MIGYLPASEDSACRFSQPVAEKGQEALSQCFIHFLQVKETLKGKLALTLLNGSSADFRQYGYSSDLAK
jgi:hypothetical protein